jgi:hypothetical protein
MQTAALSIVGEEYKTYQLSTGEMINASLFRDAQVWSHFHASEYFCHLWFECNLFCIVLDSGSYVLYSLFSPLALQEKNRHKSYLYL